MILVTGDLFAFTGRVQSQTRFAGLGNAVLSNESFGDSASQSDTSISISGFTTLTFFNALS